MSNGRRIEARSAGEGRYFEDPVEAGEWLTHSESSRWAAITHLGITLKATLLVDGDLSYVHIDADGKEVGNVPRRTTYNSEGLELDESTHNLIAYVTRPYPEERIVSGGLLLVRASGAQASCMAVELNPPARGEKISPEELGVAISTAFDRGDAFVSGVLEGQASPPYSHPIARQVNAESVS